MIVKQILVAFTDHYGVQLGYNPAAENNNPVVLGRDFAEQNITPLLAILLAPVARRLG